MTTLAAIRNDAFFFCGRGVELAEGAVSGVGASTAFDLDFDVVGGNSMIGACEFGMDGANSASACAVTHTGSAGDTTDLLLGASGTDTLGDAAGVVAATGSNASLGQPVLGATGIDTLWSRDTVQSTVASFDLSVSLILHRVDLFSAMAPARIGFRTGCAF